MDLSSLLKKSLKLSTDGRKCEDISNENRQTEINDFNKIYSNKKKSRNVAKEIPKFFFKTPKETDALAQKLREDSRALFLQKRSEEQLEHNELNELWNLLEKTQNPAAYSDEHFINYTDFVKVGQLAG